MGLVSTGEYIGVLGRHESIGRYIEVQGGQVSTVEYIGVQGDMRVQGNA